MKSGTKRRRPESPGLDVCEYSIDVALDELLNELLLLVGLLQRVNVWSVSDLFSWLVDCEFIVVEL